MMRIERSYGVLLHITSLPGRYGVGTIGEEAYSFIDLLSDSGASYWQILPTGPVSESMCWSPYSSISAFAGNELLISTSLTGKKKWFTGDFPAPEAGESSFADFAHVKEHTYSFLEAAEMMFTKNSSLEEKEDYSRFRSENHKWLDDYALFMALSEKFGSHNWLRWDRDAALRDSSTLQVLRDGLAARIEFYKFAQYLFFTQWSELRAYAKTKGIKIIGDIPIYMSMDSADAWVSKSILDIDPLMLEPLSVAGVPPDYFSETGQLWGNPVYRWHSIDGTTLNEDTYAWWLERMRHSLQLADIVRIDHFRGFESYWAVPYGDETAENGEWVKGPGIEFFRRLESDLGELSIIAEDLGVITPEVEELRDSLSLPGMKVLQFAFDQNNRNEYLPHNITDKNCIVYTGTHDNDTANGWFYNPAMYENDRRYVMEYLSMKDWSDFHLRLIREAMATIANLAIIPAQDILGYDSGFRMNTPGTVDRNWIWKLKNGELNRENMAIIKRMAFIFARTEERIEQG